MSAWPISARSDGRVPFFPLRLIGNHGKSPARRFSPILADFISLTSASNSPTEDRFDGTLRLPPAPPHPTRSRGGARHHRPEGALEGRRQGGPVLHPRRHLQR